MRLLPLLGLVVFGIANVPCLAAGNGAGAGGSGRQRAINSGLPPGDPGPPGSINNPHRDPAPPPSATHGSPRPEAQQTQ